MSDFNYRDIVNEIRERCLKGNKFYEVDNEMDKEIDSEIEKELKTLSISELDQLKECVSCKVGNLKKDCVVCGIANEIKPMIIIIMYLIVIWKSIKCM